MTRDDETHESCQCELRICERPSNKRGCLLSLSNAIVIATNVGEVGRLH